MFFKAVIHSECSFQNSFDMLLEQLQKKLTLLENYTASLLVANQEGDWSWRGWGKPKIKINALFIFNMVEDFFSFFILIVLQLILLLTLNFRVELYKSFLQRRRLKRFFFCSPSVHKMEQVTIFTHNMLPMGMFLCIKKETKHFRIVFVKGLL